MLHIIPNVFSKLLNVSFLFTECRVHHSSRQWPWTVEALLRSFDCRPRRFSKVLRLQHRIPHHVSCLSELDQPLWLNQHLQLMVSWLLQKATAVVHQAEQVDQIRTALARSCAIRLTRAFLWIPPKHRSQRKQCRIRARREPSLWFQKPLKDLRLSTLRCNHNPLAVKAERNSVSRRLRSPCMIISLLTYMRRHHVIYCAASNLPVRLWCPLEVEDLFLLLVTELPCDSPHQ